MIKKMLLISCLSFILLGCSFQDSQIGKKNEITNNTEIEKKSHDIDSQSTKNHAYIVKNGKMWAGAIVEKLEKGETHNYKKSQVLFAIYFCVHYYNEAEKVCNVLLANKIKIAKLSGITPDLYTFYMKD